MNRNSKPKPAGLYGVAAVGLLVAMPVLYVLSIGPAVRLIENDVIEQKAFETFYTPLLRLCDNHPSVARPVFWWIKLWESG